MRHALILLAALFPLPAAAETFETSAGPVEVTEAVPGLDQPWGFAFLPDFPETGAILITEKPGAVRLWEAGRLSPPLEGGPEVRDSGQGGLLDVALAPDFAESGVIFLSYAGADGVFSGRTEVARARLVRGPEPRLEDLTVIFRMEPSGAGGRHFGSRIVPMADGSLFVTLGDRGEDDQAQNLAAHHGSVLRIMADGSPFPGNPFLGREDAQPEIWSWGHRNPQGAALDEEGRLWTVEHGARGGDEVNRPEAGVNHGWPVISYGRQYSGAKIGEGTAKAGMAQPVFYWDPSIAPSGLAIYRGDLFPGWKGDLFVGALKDQLLARLDREGDGITGEERLFEGVFGRIRDVREAPDGSIWFATDDSPGALWRMAPAP